MRGQQWQQFDRHRIRVLVVDDERAIATTVGAILEEHGYDVSVFTAPEAALASVESNPPDLLLTDLMMPAMSGIELALTLRRLGHLCGVLILSGSVTAATMLADQAPSQGFELLAKPAKPGALLSTLDRLSSLFRSSALPDIA